MESQLKKDSEESLSASERYIEELAQSTSIAWLMKTETSLRRTSADGNQLQACDAEGNSGRN